MMAPAPASAPARALSKSNPADFRPPLVSALAAAEADLKQLARSSETEVESVSRAFSRLAGESDAILKQAAAIVGCVEQQSMGTVLEGVQSLCRTIGEFLSRRLEAATAIIDALLHEEQLLLRLIVLTERQEGIARHLRSLSVLTNVEVARLGSTGGNFRLLAQELHNFSKSLARQTLELARDTGHHHQSVAGTRKELAGNLPQLQAAVSRAEQDLSRTLRVIAAGLSEQAKIPEQFRRAALSTAEQIAGVVSAIQGHDITRQQIEHVEHALHLIASRVRASSGAGDLAATSLGLKLQARQLQNIQETIAGWTSQVRRCMDGIQQLSASEVSEIGPTVLRQEQELSGELAYIDALQQKSQEYSERMHATLGGLSSLVELVHAHLKRSLNIRERLQVLMYNALIEARRLGSRGAVISAIAGLIREISVDWNDLARQSRQSLDEILQLVQRTNSITEIYSDASSQQLLADQAQTRATLEGVRSAAAAVADQAIAMQAATASMRGHVAEVTNSGNRLEQCFSHLDELIQQLTVLSRSLEQNGPQTADRGSTAEVEQWLSSFYTTEIERDVMRATLHGTAMPVAGQSLAGNAVELF